MINEIRIHWCIWADAMINNTINYVSYVAIYRMTTNFGEANIW